MVSQDSNKFNRYKYQWCLNKEIPLQLRIFMPRKEKECRKKWDKITFSKNEGEKYHKSVIIISEGYYPLPQVLGTVKI